MKPGIWDVSVRRHAHTPNPETSKMVKSSNISKSVFYLQRYIPIIKDSSNGYHSK
jgi:hypothetical protein